MLVTFVIALREGLEGALIVGIVAAFLVQQGRRDLLRPLWIGVSIAAALCLAIGVGLYVFTAGLSQQKQEGLETVIGLIAVSMVTYMVIWMRRNSRGLKKQLEGATRTAMESGSGMALVTMAFLAVFREGFETSVFLLKAFQNSQDKSAGITGVLLGLAVAMVIGYGIYRGGIRLNLSKFFRATGLVLVLIAGGLVMSALRTAHEAGWLNVGQSATVDLTWLIKPNSVRWSLITGMLGLQPKPVLIEVVGWLAYVVPVGLCVAWPPGRAVPRRATYTVGAAVAATSAVAAVIALAAMPARPVRPSTTAVLTSASKTAASVRAITVTTDRAIVDLTIGTQTTRVTLAPAPVAPTAVAGRSASVYAASGVVVADPTGLPTTQTPAQVVAANSGRLPLGAKVGTARTIPMTYRTTAGVSIDVDEASGALLSAEVSRATSAIATFATGPAAVGTVADLRATSAPASVRTAVAFVTSAQSQRQHRAVLTVLAWGAGFLGLLSVLLCAGLALVTRRRRAVAAGLPAARQAMTRTEVPVS